VAGRVSQDVAHAAGRVDRGEWLPPHARPLDAQIGAEPLDDAILATDGDDLPRPVNGLAHAITSFPTPE